MKCPFMTVTTTNQLYAQQGSVTTTEFADCYKELCPYFGERVYEYKPEGGFKSVINPKCRRTEDGGK